MRGGKTGRAGADDGYFFRVDDLRLFGKYVNRVPGFRAETLGQKPLQRADGNRQIEISSPARRLARMATNSAAYGCKRIGDSRVSVRLLVTSLCDQRHVPSGLGVDWTCCHAREIRFEPIEIDKFRATLHRSESPVPSTYFLTVSSTAVVPAETSTDCVVGLPSSLQVLSVYFPAGIFLISKLPSLSVTAK